MICSVHFLNYSEDSVNTLSQNTGYHITTYMTSYNKTGSLISTATWNEGLTTSDSCYEIK